MHRHASTLLILAGISCAAPAAAQMPTGPSKELNRYESWLGTWRGSGQWQMEPDAAPAGWTSTTTYTKVMNGYWIRELNRIELQGMPEGMPTSLCFSSMIGWDNENKRHIKIEAGNTGIARMMEMHWVADNQIVTYHTGMDPTTKAPMIERWVNTIEGDQQSFAADVATGSGAFFTHVWGKMEKVSDTAVEMDMNAAPMTPMPATEMGKLAKMAGIYSNKGWYQMSPATPKQEFTGTETVAMHYGNHVLTIRVQGDPMEAMGGMAYEMNAWMTWNGQNKCYDMFFVSSMGEVGKNTCWLMDGKMISANMGVWMGVPTLGRGIITMNDDGSIRESVGHVMMADGTPMQNFANSYSLRDD